MQYDLRRLMVYVCAILPGLALVCGVVADRTACGASPVIEKNTQSLGKISSYHVVISGQSTMTLAGEVVLPLDKDGVIEIWKQGLRRRQLVRGFRSSGPDGAKPAGRPHGDVTETSVDDREVRQLRGWDEEHPYLLPIEFGRSAKEFSAVKGTISPRDPTALTTQVEATSFLWHAAPGFTLGEAVSVSEFEELPSSGESVTRLKLVSTREPKLEPFVGTVIDVDHDHGYMIRRIERAENEKGVQAVYEVQEFMEAAPGIWFPREVHITAVVPSHKMTRSATGKLELCEVNIPIEEDSLQVQFPEGAMVAENNPDRKLHLWGKGEPAKTFADNSALMDYVYARAREFQGVGGGPPPAGGGSRWLWIVLANVVLVSLLIFFTYMRRRLSSPKTEA